MSDFWCGMFFGVYFGVVASVAICGGIAEQEKNAKIVAEAKAKAETSQGWTILPGETHTSVHILGINESPMVATLRPGDKFLGDSITIVCAR